MASSTTLLLLLLSILGFLAISSNARPGLHFHPCRIVFISSFTVSQNPNPKPNPRLSTDQNPPQFLSIFSDFRGLRPHRPLGLLVDLEIDSASFQLRRGGGEVEPRQELKKQREQVPFGGFGVSSIRDRTKDILSVVVALLFGVGCGALTSATMYLAWSLITNRYEGREGGEFSDDDDDDDDEIPSPKKMGYQKIPVEAKAVDAGAVAAQVKAAAAVAV
ncbi:hypothetical protein Sjap_018236 [Stephania japonica]|uniref:Transmembrane protein n=1 Tax=Stephania japonica TaxID=461633 RepID=A0AAP0I8A9_9MAGN